MTQQSGVSGDGGDAVREQLAAIEHERWADWQKWMHSRMTLQGIGYNLPADLFQRWQRQIATKYADLPAKEKASDMKQVDRYWPIIERLLDEQYNAGLDAAEGALPEKPYHLEGSGGTGNIENKSWKVYEQPASSIIDAARRQIRALRKGSE